jgi:hypothetical protein
MRLPFIINMKNQVLEGQKTALRSLRANFIYKRTASPIRYLAYFKNSN